MREALVPMMMPALSEGVKASAGSCEAKHSVHVGLKAQLLSAQGNALGNHAHPHPAPCKGS